MIDFRQMNASDRGGGEVRAVLELALARYPDTHPGLAISQLMSDRNHAKLGALGSPTRARRNGDGPFASKTNDWTHHEGRVLYKLGYRRARHVDWDPPSWVDYVPIEEFHKLETMPTRIRPEIAVSLWIKFAHHDFTTQRGRTIVAKTLRDTRRKLRAEVAKAEARS